MLVQLTLLAVAGGAWLWLAADAPGQSIGAAAGHGLVVLVAAGVLSVHAVVTTLAVAYTAVRRRSSWGRLAAIHLVGLPVSIALVAAVAWIAVAVDDQLLPRVRGTEAWNRAHAEERLRACRPVGLPRLLDVGDGAALLVLDLPLTVDDSPRIRDAVFRGVEGAPSWRLRKSGRPPSTAFERRPDRFRLWAALEPSAGDPPDVSLITLACNDGTLILEVGRDGETFLAAGSVVVLTGPLPQVEIVPGDEVARERYQRLFGPRQLTQAPVPQKRPRAPASAGGPVKPSANRLAPP